MLGFTETQSRALHLTWIAFFLTFIAWFNMAPFNTTIMYQLGLKEAEINILEDRALILLALKSVDYVVSFDDETPLNLIKKVIWKKNFKFH